ncbi:MAG: hypothetical protein V4459_08185 [Pseudomonadota bacterium]
MIRIALLAAAALSLALPADAQDKVPDAKGDQSDIIVNGRRDRDRDKQVETFVKSLAPTGDSGQLARWNGQACVAMVGLWPERRAYLLDRIGAVAKLLDVSYKQAPKCAPNTLIVFTTDADKFAADAVDKYPDLVRNGMYGRPSRKELARYVAPRPVRWFTINMPTMADGQRVGSMDADGKVDVEPTIIPASRIRTRIRMNTFGGLIVVDEGKVGGIKWPQLADYLAMVMFAQPQIDGNFAGADSVMAIFAARDAGKPGPAGLTPQDRSFLTALYRTDADLTASQQRGVIGDKVKKTFKAQ